MYFGDMATLFNYGFVPTLAAASTRPQEATHKLPQHTERPPSPPGGNGDKYDGARCLFATPPDTPPRTPPMTPLPALPSTSSRPTTSKPEAVPPSQTRGKPSATLRRTSTRKKYKNGMQVEHDPGRKLQHKDVEPLSLRAQAAAQPGRPEPVLEDKDFAVPPAFTATIFPSSDAVRLATIPSESFNESERVQRVKRAKELRAQSISHGGPSQLVHSQHDDKIPTPVLPAVSSLQQYHRSRSGSWHSILQHIEQDMALTPIEMDLGALEFIANLPKSAQSPARKGSIEDSLQRAILKRTATASSGVTMMAVELPGGPTIAVVTPEQNAWKQTKFLPGPIRLEPRSMTERSPLEMFQETFGPAVVGDHIDAEGLVVDELTSFVQSYGEAFEVDESGLDAYWESSSLPATPGSGPVTKYKGNLRVQWPTPLKIVKSQIPSWEDQSPEERLHHSQKRTSGDYESIRKDLPGDSIRRTASASSSLLRSRRTAVSMPTSATQRYSSLRTTRTPKAGSSMTSPGILPVSSTSGGSGQAAGSNGRRVKAGKAKKGLRSGQKKLSIRGLIRSAASIV